MRRKPTEKELQRIDALAEQGGEEYYEDMPELDEDFFRHAIRVSEMVGKTKVSIRLDDDVIDWLKQQGRGYQTRANRILRAAMEHDLRQN